MFSGADAALRLRLRLWHGSPYDDAAERAEQVDGALGASVFHRDFCSLFMETRSKNQCSGRHAMASETGTDNTPPGRRARLSSHSAVSSDTIRPMPNRISIGASLAMFAVVTLGGCAQLEGARLYKSGTAALDRGEAEQAIADLELAAVRVPEASEVQNHLGLAYAAAGRDDDALNAFRRAVDLDCENAAAEKNLRAAARHNASTASP